MKQYIIEDFKGNNLSSNNSVTFEYWCSATNRDAIKYNLITGLIKLNFIKFIWCLYGGYSKKIKLVEVVKHE